jgi:benzoyl-CoA reductase/2-hydroxyglutaryl-CoA dehydratase subunit BcrC/BadD/HgdB
MRKSTPKRRAKIDSNWESEYLAPPLDISSLSKSLVTNNILRSRRANRKGKVAWVTSGAPFEFLKALGFFVHYPENHAAICGTVRLVEEISTQAENAGYSRDLCAYSRTDIGSVLSGITPLGRLPKPDLLLACTNICQTILHWYRVLAHHYDIPLILIDTPFIYTEMSDHDLAYVLRQLEDAIPQAEGVAGESLDESKLREVIRLSREASQLWMEVLERCQHRPAPISVFDQFIQMAPIVAMRGETDTVDFYAEMLKEVEVRIRNGIGAVYKERKRLLWDNLPIWFQMRYLAETFGKHRIVIAASTYTNAWGELAELFDPERPYESMARTYLHPILNRGTGHKLKTMLRMIDDYHLDGAILHSNRSCKPYSVGQIDQRNRLIGDHGVATLLFEADQSDPRSYSKEQVANRVEAFIEMLGV